MEYQRVYEILRNKEKTDVMYQDRPVWIQEINQHMAKVGFIDNFEEKDVYIEDLYEYDNNTEQRGPFNNKTGKISHDF